MNARYKAAFPFTVYHIDEWLHPHKGFFKNVNIPVFSTYPYEMSLKGYLGLMTWKLRHRTDMST